MKKFFEQVRQILYPLIVGVFASVIGGVLTLPLQSLNLSPFLRRVSLFLNEDVKVWMILVFVATVSLISALSKKKKQ